MKCFVSVFIQMMCSSYVCRLVLYCTGKPPLVSRKSFLPTTESPCACVTVAKVARSCDCDLWCSAVCPVGLPCPCVQALSHITERLCFALTEGSTASQVARHSLSYIQEMGNGWFGKVRISWPALNLSHSHPLKETKHYRRCLVALLFNNNHKLEVSL